MPRELPRERVRPGFSTRHLPLWPDHRNHHRRREDLLLRARSEILVLDLRRLRSHLPRSHAKPLESAVVVRALAAFGITLSLARPAAASPQGHVAYRTGVCGTGTDALWQDTHWCNGVVADLLFFRKRNSDFALGPYAEVSTAGFWDARYGGGLSALAPVTPDFPLVLSLGAFGHETRAVALGANAFFGLRSYNFHGSY